MPRLLVENRSVTRFRRLEARKLAQFVGDVQPNPDLPRIGLGRGLEMGERGFAVAARAGDAAELRQRPDVARLLVEDFPADRFRFVEAGKLAQFGGDVQPNPDLPGIGLGRGLEMGERGFAVAARAGDAAALRQRPDVARLLVENFPADRFRLVGAGKLAQLVGDLDPSPDAPRIGFGRGLKIGERRAAVAAPARFMAELDQRGKVFPIDVRHAAHMLQRSRALAGRQPTPPQRP